MNLRVLTIAALILVAGVSASMVEDTLSPVAGEWGTLQHDGHFDGDAPDVCEKLNATRVLPTNNHEWQGLLIPYDDERDLYYVETTAEQLNSRVSVTLELPGETRADFSILLDDCLTSVFDDPRYNNESAAMAAAASGPAPGEETPPGTERQTPNTLAGGCTKESWHFVIHDMRGYAAPSEVYMKWYDGTTSIAPLTTDTGSTAHYRYSDNPTGELVDAWAFVPTGWDGKFHSNGGFCDAPDDEEPEPPEAPTREGNTITWTATDVGLWVVDVQYLEPEMPSPQPSSGPQQVGCHYCYGVELLQQAAGYELISLWPAEEQSE